ncbi:MAG TPA: cell division protein FtsZ [Patescibacteria group bacterium]|jgi:cell division protein FtsZ|nr:cell division protein FtsZ [Patescibacteria group bacterium]
MIDFEVTPTQKVVNPTIKVVCVGGAGGNTGNAMIESGCTDIECIAVNTDAQALNLSKAPIKIQIGMKSTKGLGTGADPLVGRRAAEEDLDKVMEAIGQADIVFLTGGMGGGTGSGVIPIIAKALKERNILTITIVTKPFEFEGKRRCRVAEEIVKQLESLTDTLIVIPNQKLLAVCDVHMAMIDAFGMINQVLSQSVRAISDIITRPGHINVDYADVRTIMKDRGIAVMGTGKASGKDRAEMASLQAISSPLLENMHIEGAHAVLLNITGNKTLTLDELSKAASIVYEAAHEDANIILGTVIDESLKDEVMITIIATGFEKQQTKQIMMQEEKGAYQSYTIHNAPKQEVQVQAAQKGSEEVNHKEVAIESHFTSNVSEIVHHQSSACMEFNEQRDTIGKSEIEDLDIPTFLRNKKNNEYTV